MSLLGVYLCFYLQFVIAVQTTGLFGLGLYGFQRMCFCRCGVSRRFSGNTRTGRGDRSVGPHEYPWLAAINIGPQILAGSLISDRHVITTASQLHGLTPDRLVVTLGAHDRCTIGGSALNVSVESITIRPGYNPTSQENDLALIKLKHVVAYSRYVSPICLPVFDTRGREQVTLTAGWSQMNSSCIPHVSILPTLPIATCLKEIDSMASHDKGCLGPLGVKSAICKEDVGSPVMVRWSSTSALRLIGVVSTSSCDVTTPPSYTRVIDHIDWIYENIRRDCQCL